MWTFADPTVQSIIAILVGQVETSISIEILDHEVDVLALTARTHGLQLTWRIVTGKHATGLVAGIINEGTGLFAVVPRRAVGKAAG